jgi:DNA-binding beta-propeller fold protein YncE
VREIDRALGTTLLTIHGIAPGGLAVTGAATEDTVWASEPSRNLLVRIDAKAGRVARQIPIPDRPTRIAANPRTVWVATRGASHELWRIDADSGRRVARIPLPITPTRVALGAGSVWVTGYHWSNGLNASRGGTVLRIDPATNRISASIPLGDVAADGVTLSHGLIWVAATPNCC